MSLEEDVQNCQKERTGSERPIAGLSKESLPQLSQEMGVSISTCQRAARAAKLCAFRVTAMHQLTLPDKVKRLNYCHGQACAGISRW